MPLSVLSLRVPRESENTPEQTAQLLASLAKACTNPGLLSRSLGTAPIYLSLEITLDAGQLLFTIVFPPHLSTFVQSQMLATYPDVVMSEIKDYIAGWPSVPYLSLIRQSYAPYFPLRDYTDYKEVDPMLPLLGVLSKAGPDDKILVQFILYPPSATVQSRAYKYLHPAAKTDPATGKPVSHEPPPEGKKLIEDKLSQPLVGVSIHFAVSRPQLLHDLYGAVSVLNRPDGNSLIPAKLLPWHKNRLWSAVTHRRPFTSHFVPPVTLNVMELSSLWHLPGVYTKIPNVAWSASSSFSEPPENLPVFIKPPVNLSLKSPSPKVGEGRKGEVHTSSFDGSNALEERKEEVPEASDPNRDINYFASTTYRNQSATFGIKLEDRLRHVYVLGKSGTGKSTLLENMAIDDFKKGRGVAFIDPHGDSSDNLLNYIPKNRINDVVYFNPADREHPVSLNILESKSPEHAELVASGIMAIFHKLYGHSWGPRLEYILRNTILTLAYVPGTTLPDVITMLTDEKFRHKIYKLQTINPQLAAFWHNEYDRLDDKARTEQISSILNKVGQFVSSPLIHNIISHSKSTIDLADVLNSGKILIANLSQGKLGEDNAALLGAMLVTQIELAAMSRVDQPLNQRKPFFLYVDEFQNFATESFIKILSEARKFRLGLIMANQYISQIPEPIQKAIFGNAGTIVSFVVGSDDARIMEAEFGNNFSQASLVSLAKYQIAMRMTIDGQVSQPFLAVTLPPFKSVNQNREKVISASRLRYSLKK